MFLACLFLSVLLTAVGWMLYTFLIRKRCTALQRKIFLFVVLVGSIGLPYPILQSVQATYPFTFLQGMSGGQPEVQETEIIACYEKALTDQEFCQCEDLAAENIVIFQESNFIETCIECKTKLSSGVWIGGALFLLLLILQVGYLIYLIYASEKEKIVFDGRKYFLLKGVAPHLAASFRLFGSYILWRPELDNMERPVKDAVLYHEIAHLRYFDTYTQILLSSFRLFWFLNPFFFRIQREIRLISEFLADRYAISHTGSPSDYAGLLVRIKEEQLKYNLIQAFGGADLKQRILYIMKPPSGSVPGFSLSLLVAFCLMTCTALIAAPPIKSQINTIDQYKVVHTKTTTTGKKYFCKTCIVDELQNSCLMD